MMGKKIKINNKKKKIKIVKNLLFLLIITVFILSSCSILVIVRNYYINFHNLDLILNYMNIADQVNSKIYKYNVSMNSIFETSDYFGKGRSIILADSYSNSLDGMENSFVMLGLLVGCWCFCLSYMFERIKW